MAKKPAKERIEVLHVRMPADLDRRLRLFCTQQKIEDRRPRSRTAVTIEALETYLKRRGFGDSR